MAISSSNCKSLNSPLITMLVRVLKPNGEMIERAFEMTLDQFNVSILFSNIFYCLLQHLKVLRISET